MRRVLHEGQTPRPLQENRASVGLAARNGSFQWFDLAGYVMSKLTEALLDIGYSESEAAVQVCAVVYKKRAPSDATLKKLAISTNRMPCSLICIFMTSGTKQRRDLPTSCKCTSS